MRLKVVCFLTGFFTLLPLFGDENDEEKKKSLNQNTNNRPQGAQRICKQNTGLVSVALYFTLYTILWKKGELGLKCCQIRNYIFTMSFVYGTNCNSTPGEVYQAYDPSLDNIL